MIVQHPRKFLPADSFSPAVCESKRELGVEEQKSIQRRNFEEYSRKAVSEEGMTNRNVDEEIPESLSVRVSQKYKFSNENMSPNPNSCRNEEAKVFWSDERPKSKSVNSFSRQNSSPSSASRSVSSSFASFVAKNRLFRLKNTHFKGLKKSKEVDVYVRRISDCSKGVACHSLATSASLLCYICLRVTTNEYYSLFCAFFAILNSFMVHLRILQYLAGSAWAWDRQSSFKKIKRDAN